MSYIGEVQDGRVVFAAALPLPNGTRVRVESIEASPNDEISEKEPPTIAEIFKDVIGVVDDLPSDMAEQHDHYLYGTPKK